MNALTRRPHAAVAMAVAAVVLALLPTGTAQAATTTKVGLKASSGVVSYDRTVTLSGQVRAGSKKVARARVQLNRKSSKGWRKVAVTRSSRTGAYSFKQTLRIGGSYRVSVAKAAGRTSATSKVVTVRVRPPLSRVTASGSSTGGVGSSRIFRGTVAKGLAGRAVEVQGYHPTKGWRRVARGKVARDGSFAVRATMSAWGHRNHRVVLPASSGYVSRTSNVLELGTYGGVVGRLSTAPACDGAAALGPGACDANLGTRVTPALGQNESDTDGAYACYVQEPSQLIKRCSYGSTSKDALKVAVTGDSHGGMLVPALRDVAAKLNWKLDTYVGRGCVLSRTTASDPCRNRRNDLAKRLRAGGYDLVIVTAFRGVGTPDGPDTRPQDYAAAYRSLLSVGTKVAVVADNPRMSEAAVSCTKAARSYSALRRCATPRTEAFAQTDPAPAAVAQAKGAILVDVTERMCSSSTCPTLIGHVQAYRDDHHLTATFAKTLIPYILEDIVGRL